MINQDHANKLINWCKSGYIYEDANGTGFYANVDERVGGKTYLAIPNEYCGLFLPVDFEKEFSSGLSSGCAFGEREPYEQEANHPCNLHKLIDMHFYDISLHDDSIMSAFSFAGLHHKYQRRKVDDSPYILHLIEVAQLVRQLGGVSDLDVLKAAFLHDIVEDTHVSINSVELFFGEKVALIVSELTCFEAESTEEKRVKLLNQLKYASQESRLLKLADLSSNVSSIPVWPANRIAEYVTWCEEAASICRSASPALYVYFRRCLNTQLDLT